MLITRNAFKLFYNALVQKMKDFKGNWNQNDPTAHDYIKNRPFYSEGYAEITIVPTTTIVANSDNSENVISYSPIIPFEDGQIYSVTWNNVNYECTAVEIDGIVGIGNFGFFGNSDTGEPFIISIDEYEFGGAYIFSLYAGEHTVSVVQTKENVVKIDKKYLPDLPDMDYVSYEKWQDLAEDQMAMARENIGAGTSNFSGDYRDLKNQPTIYQYVVRYDANQSLTDDDKSKARNNIDAISMDEAVSVTVQQNLTDRQKELARANIGASDFDGHFESLIDAPNFMTLDTAQNVPNRKVLNFGQNQSVDGTMTGLEINTCMWKDTDGEMNYHTLLGNGAIKMSRTYADGTSQEMMLSPGIIATGMDTIQFQRHHALSGQSVRIVNLLDPVDYNDAATKGYVDEAISEQIESEMTNFVKVTEDEINALFQ